MVCNIGKYYLLFKHLPTFFIKRLFLHKNKKLNKDRFI